MNIPAGVTTIPSQAFFQCVNLASVILPAGITGIGNNAFHVCTSLARAVFAGAAPGVDTCQSAPAAGGFTACLFDGAAGFTAPTWEGHASVNPGDPSGAPDADGLTTYQEVVTRGDGNPVPQLHETRTEPRRFLRASRMTEP